MPVQPVYPDGSGAALGHGIVCFKHPYLQADETALARNISTTFHAIHMLFFLLNAFNFTKFMFCLCFW